MQKKVYKWFQNFKDHFLLDNDKEIDIKGLKNLFRNTNIKNFYFWVYF